MIKGINQNSRHIIVTGGTTSMPYINNYNSSNNSVGGQSFTGQLRYNSSNQNLEVFDGNMWQQMMGTYSSIGLTAEAESAIDWARKKMLEEIQLKSLMEKHPGLKELHDKFKMMEVLCKEEEKLEQHN